MAAPRVPVEVLRLLTLITVGLVAALPLREQAESTAASASSGDVGSSLALAAVAAAFAALAVLGRLGPDGVRSQPRSTLALEGLVATALAVVPAERWEALTGGPEAVPVPTDGRLSALAGVWLAVVVVTAVRLRIERRRQPASQRHSIFT